MSRLKERYTKEIAPAMGKEYGYKNVMAIPKLEKIVINIGLGKRFRTPSCLTTRPTS
jgi:large subunit ribosomal protein L5